VLALEDSQVGWRESLVCQKAGKRRLRGWALGCVGQVHRGHAGRVEEVPTEAGYHLGHCELTGMGILRHYGKLGTRGRSIGTRGIGCVTTAEGRESATEQQRRQPRTGPVPAPLPITSSHLNLRTDERTGWRSDASASLARSGLECKPSKSGEAGRQVSVSRVTRPRPVRSTRSTSSSVLHPSEALLYTEPTRSSWRTIGEVSQRGS
jgi:hypothetical protein